MSDGEEAGERGGEGDGGLGHGSVPSDPGSSVHRVPDVPVSMRWEDHEGSCAGALWHFAHGAK